MAEHSFEKPIAVLAKAPMAEQRSGIAVKLKQLEFEETIYNDRHTGNCQSGTGNDNGDYGYVTGSYGHAGHGYNTTQNGSDCSGGSYYGYYNLSGGYDFNGNDKAEIWLETLTESGSFEFAGDDMEDGYEEQGEE